MKYKIPGFSSSVAFASLLLFSVSNVQAAVATSEAMATIFWDTFTFSTDGTLVTDAYPPGPPGVSIPPGMIPMTPHGDNSEADADGGPYVTDFAPNWFGISESSTGPGSSASSFTDLMILQSMSGSFDGDAYAESARLFEIMAMHGEGTVSMSVEVLLEASLLSGIDGYADAAAGLGVSFGSGFSQGNFADLTLDSDPGFGVGGPGSEMRALTLTFEFDMVAGDRGTIFAVAEAETYASSPIPVPAAVWLFGSGLLGLVAVARRKIVS